ncbi:MAG TPA: hypothetical protein DCR46_02795 [Cytophagales bacterium]|nr:hypothetical protein [Cytophagales bacterium]
MKKFLIIISNILLLQHFTAFAQFDNAERHYKKMRYALAIEAYEEAFKFNKPNLDALEQLGDSYFKIGDTKNAERVLALYMSDTSLVNPDVYTIFLYGQTLAQNGKYEEASHWFGRYHNVKTLKDDSRGDDFSKAYKHNIHDFYKDSVLYDVYRLDINSPQSDFSPTFYKKGIVFASARRKENGIRRVHAWNNAAFLDMYYVDTNSINERIFSTHIGKEKASDIGYSYTEENKVLHSDETFSTGNDSKTLGYHAHIFKGDSNEYHSSDPKPLPHGFNNRRHDGPCTFTPNQKMIVFTRNNSKGGFAKRSKDGVNKMGLYYSFKEDSLTWKKVAAFPYNSKQYSTAHPAFAPDGKTMYFASDMPGGFGGSDLYKTTFDGTRWSKPENLGPKINTDGSDIFPFIDNHGVLYFASNGHPGLGGLDLFRFEDKKVIHMNYPISSKKDDFGIAVWADGRKGYISSNRHYGGFDDDLYYFEASKAMILAGKVLNAKTNVILPNTRIVLFDTLGKVLAETISDEEGNYRLQIEHQKIYRITGSKNRYHDSTATISTVGIRGTNLNRDLHLWDKLNVMLIGTITDRETNEKIDSAQVRIVDKKTGQELFNDYTKVGLFQNLIRDKKFNDEIAIDIHVSKQNYLGKLVNFNSIVTDSGEIILNLTIDLAIDKIKVGIDVAKVLKLNPIYYDFDKADIRPDAAVELDKVVEAMVENPALVIELGSHTDCRGKSTRNQQLSEWRAKSAVDYIVSKGIDKSRIYSKGYGESKLLNNCACEGDIKSSCLEEEHQLNRRTEFIIVKM